MTFNTAAQRALDAWRIVTCDMIGMAVNLSKSQIFHRQDHGCYLCDDRFARGALELHGSNSGAPSRDHVFPRVQGGRADANILLAHKSCNNLKGDRWPYPCEVIYLASIYAKPGAPLSRNGKRKARRWARRS
jgi:hypothetical protein